MSVESVHLHKCCCSSYVTSFVVLQVLIATFESNESVFIHPRLTFFRKLTAESRDKNEKEIIIAPAVTIAACKSSDIKLRK